MLVLGIRDSSRCGDIVVIVKFSCQHYYHFVFPPLIYSVLLFFSSRCRAQVEKNCHAVKYVVGMVQLGCFHFKKFPL